MRFPGRVLSVGALAALLVALPGGGVASNSNLTKEGTTSSGVGPAIRLPGGMDAAQPALSVVSGARIGAVGSADLTAWSAAGVATIVDEELANGYLFYNSTSGLVMAPLGLPAGATLWQIDVYGWALPPGSAQTWFLYDQEADGGDFTNARNITIASGAGIRTGTMTFSGGLTLANGHNWQIALGSTNSANGFDGVVFQYTLPTLSFVPITPVRVFDSRFSSKIVQGAPRTINVKDAINVNTGAVTTPNAIPVGAKAVSYTVTATNTGIPGFVSVLPGTTTTVTASTINWTASGATIAAGGTVSLGIGAAERQVTLVVGGAGSASTDVIVDITGYYM